MTLPWRIHVRALSAERRANLVIMTIGIAAAFFLLDRNVPGWLRILPWALVFGYPVWRMFRLGRRE
jgi:hypothetical protein